MLLKFMVIQDEEDLAWDYFDQDPFTSLGYDSTINREFDVLIDKQSFVIVTFTLTFDAATFKNNFPTNGQVFLDALFRDLIVIKILTFE